MRIEQSSEQVSEKKWKWWIWLEGTEEELDRVEKVVYYLHPTFTDSVREMTNRDEKFRLESAGWGTFVVRIEIHDIDGAIDERRHRLRFSRTEPQVFVSAAANEQQIVGDVTAALENLQIGVRTAQDVSAGDDWQSEIRGQIDRSKAVVVINGNMPSRWVMEELDVAKSLGKPIISIGQSEYYDTEGAMEVASIDELQDAIDKLPE